MCFEWLGANSCMVRINRINENVKNSSSGCSESEKDWYNGAVTQNLWTLLSCRDS
jgi:hypothetical protein